MERVEAGSEVVVVGVEVMVSRASSSSVRERKRFVRGTAVVRTSLAWMYGLVDTVAQ